eukprot:m51a1_g2487 hypothetical protein (274) ;mRNA; r:85997-87908
MRLSTLVLVAGTLFVAATMVSWVTLVECWCDISAVIYNILHIRNLDVALLVVCILFCLTAARLLMHLAPLWHALVVVGCVCAFYPAVTAILRSTERRARASASLLAVAVYVAVFTAPFTWIEGKGPSIIRGKLPPKPKIIAHKLANDMVSIFDLSYADNDFNATYQEVCKVVNSHLTMSEDDWHEAQRMGMWVNVYTVNSRWLFSQMWVLGVDSVTSGESLDLKDLKSPVFVLTVKQYRWIWASVESVALVAIAAQAVFIIYRRARARGGAGQ